MRRLWVIAAIVCATLPIAARAADDNVLRTVLVPTFTSPGLARFEYLSRCTLATKTTTCSGTPSQGTLDEYQTAPTGPGTGTFGWIIKLQRASGRFSLGSVADDTGIADFDVTFYSSIGDLSDLNDPFLWLEHPPDSPAGTPVGPGVMCHDTAAICSGTIPGGARYAVVTLSLGVNAQFRFRTYA